MKKLKGKDLLSNPNTFGKVYEVKRGRCSVIKKNTPTYLHKDTFVFQILGLYIKSKGYVGNNCKPKFGKILVWTIPSHKVVKNVKKNSRIESGRKFSEKFCLNKTFKQLFTYKDTNTNLYWTYMIHLIYKHMYGKYKA